MGPPLTHKYNKSTALSVRSYIRAPQLLRVVPSFTLSSGKKKSSYIQVEDEVTDLQKLLKKLHDSPQQALI